MKLPFVVAIVLFVVAAGCIYLALQPKLAFHIDEGWKFKNKTEPSQVYEGVSTLRFFIGAILAAALGVTCVVLGVGQAREAESKASAAESYRRCVAEVLPRFNSTIKWDGRRVANKDELDSLAKELGVRVRLESREDYYVESPETYYGDMVNVYDTQQPETGGLIFSYIGGSHDGQGPYTVGDHQVHCYTERGRIVISEPLTR